MRDPISLTPEILAMLDRHKPDKTKHAKLLTISQNRESYPTRRRSYNITSSGKRRGKQTA